MRVRDTIKEWLTEQGRAHGGPSRRLMSSVVFLTGYFSTVVEQLYGKTVFPIYLVWKIDFAPSGTAQGLGWVSRMFDMFETLLHLNKVQIGLLKVRWLAGRGPCQNNRKLHYQKRPADSSLSSDLFSNDLHHDLPMSTTSIDRIKVHKGN